MLCSVQAAPAKTVNAFFSLHFYICGQKFKDDFGLCCDLAETEDIYDLFELRAEFQRTS